MPMLQGKIIGNSQANVLRARMKKAGFTHSQEARVNLRGVRFEPTTESEGVVYFCNIGRIKVLKVLQQGDRQALPRDAVAENLRFPGRGSHDIFGAIIHSNGALRIRADSKTRVERHRLFFWWN